MRKFILKVNCHRMIAIFLSMCVLISMSEIHTISANAETGTKASDAAIDLVTLSAGAELASGAYYLSESKTFGSASTMNNGLKIKSGATVYIYLPDGVTLTAIGGGTNAVRQQGGYAGILLPSSSKLIILGEGKVVATGGRAGNGASGSSGNAGFITWSGDDRYYGGGGGAGGAGGGGAGAGIGTNGGNGGNGGSATGNGATKYNGDENYDGANGNSGGNGSTASSCGTLYVQTTITLTATGGLGGTAGGSGGSNGSNEWEGANDDDKWDGKQYHTAGGGGGGGGGGAGYSAYGIGTGGAGGGGGGSGGQGGIDYTKDTDHDGPKTNASCSASGGSGGSGYYSGSSGYGTRDTGTYDGSWKKVGGSGGSGGSTGSGSSSKSALSSGWTDKNFTVTFKGVSAETVQQTAYTFEEETQTITVPTYNVALEDGYRFTGWSVSAYGISPVAGVKLTGTDTRVYKPGDRIEVGSWLSGSIVLEPVISEINCKVYFDDKGGSVGNRGQEEALLKSDMTIQSNVTVPTRVGYDFRGYYTGMVNGTQYYDETGVKVYNNAIAEGVSKVNLYAQWSIHSSTLTIDPNGGALEGETSFTKKYNESITIKDPLDTSGNDKTFLRWVLLDTITGNSSNNGKIITGAGYTTFTFGADTTAVTLKAVWSGPGEARLEVKEGITQDVTSANLERIFLHVAEDSDKGLTAEESVAEQKEVVLSIENIEVDTENDVTIQESVESIETMLENSTFESLNYYDISVNKIINGEDKGKLKELPEVVKITIELTGELADKSGYSVYRVHEGVAEQMSSSRSSEEYYEVGDGAITIYTKKFSTYAITASSSVIGEWKAEELNSTNNSAATDVQGMYVDSSSARVYKVDVEWGAMKFEFNKHQKWNPDNHSYNEEVDIYLDESAYEDGNNAIVITNHSNADVRVGMAIVEQSLEGIDIFLKQQNDDASDAAVDMYLNRVSDASGDGTVSSVNAFVRLGSGTLTEDGYEALTADGRTNVFQQIARVLITIEAVEGSETTPLYFGSGD